MNTVFFENPEEAAAWDKYLCLVLGKATLGIPDEKILKAADAMILERRKRMAPEKKRETLFFGKPASELTEGELSALAASGIYP